MTSYPLCPNCPFTIPIDLEASDAPMQDYRLVRLNIDKAQVILTRRQFIEGLRRGKALKRYEALQQRTPPAEEPQS